MVVAHKPVGHTDTVGVELAQAVGGGGPAGRRIGGIRTQGHRALLILAPVQQGAKTANRLLPIEPALVDQGIDRMGLPGCGIARGRVRHPLGRLRGRITVIIELHPAVRRCLALGKPAGHIQIVDALRAVLAPQAQRVAPAQQGTAGRG